MNIIKQDRILFPEIFWSLPQNINKRGRGSVLIVAGSAGMAGAGVLAAEGAFRAGAGVVTLAHPDSLIDVYKKMLPETMTLPLPSTPSGSIAASATQTILEKISSYDVIAIGPGLSKNMETMSFVKEVLKKLKKPKVVDASAIYAFEDNPELIDEYTILTPHTGEMSAVIKGIKKQHHDAFKKFGTPTQIDADKATCAKEFVALYSQSILVLKGDHTVIGRGDEVIINQTGNPGMSKAGMGDVLTGVVAGMIALNFTSSQGKEVFESTATAVYLHSLAGDLAAKSIGERSIVASDVIKSLPEAIKHSEKTLD